MKHLKILRNYPQLFLDVFESHRNFLILLDNLTNRDDKVVGAQIHDLVNKWDGFMVLKTDSFEGFSPKEFFLV